MSKTRSTLTELVGNLITSAEPMSKDNEVSVVLKSCVEDLEEHTKFIDSSDESVILELARVALGDAHVFDFFADKLDLSDEYMSKLRGKVESLTQGVDIEY